MDTLFLNVPGFPGGNHHIIFHSESFILVFVFEDMGGVKTFVDRGEGDEIAFYPLPLFSTICIIFSER